jgi:hypothetical protein
VHANLQVLLACFTHNNACCVKLWAKLQDGIRILTGLLIPRARALHLKWPFVALLTSGPEIA